MAKKGSFLAGALIGGATAAAIALLLAPKSGRELRDDLAKKADDLRDLASDYTDDFVLKTNEFGEIVKEKVSDTVDDFDDSVDEVTASLKQQSSDLSDRFRKAASEAADSATDILIDADELEKEEAADEVLSEKDPAPLEDLAELKEEVEKNNPED